jgi:hypothetical protein
MPRTPPPRGSAGTTAFTHFRAAARLLLPAVARGAALIHTALAFRLDSPSHAITLSTFGAEMCYSAKLICRIVNDSYVIH